MSNKAGLNSIRSWNAMWENCPFVKEELIAFESYIASKYPPGNSFLNNTSNEMILSGGKRLRPALVIISGMMGNYEREKIFPVAAAIETLHTATLIHDDIIDNAKTRRGQLTVSEKNGINLAVYTGDYLLANSILLLSESGLHSERLERVAKAAKMICIGEVNQYLNRFKMTTVNEYLRRIMKKTGILFSASCALGAYASGCSGEQVNVLERFGMNLGVAFQIRDDIIDIESDEKEAGKPVANDIREGIFTLPFLLAAKRSKAISKRIEEFLCGTVEVEGLMIDVRKAGGVDGAKKLKDRYITRCRELLSHFTPKVGSTLAADGIYAMEEILKWL
ncbi:MAG TPA: polyprenyl synthetase family protein [Clostridiaceae bacterium]|nr:polyprenyl synthetase family protein [Clostridiaceae bacterium]